MAPHFTAHAGSGSCALCDKHSTDLWAVTLDGSLKLARICYECHDKIIGKPNELFTRLMRMLD
jgi:hypothetical protein